MKKLSLILLFYSLSLQANIRIITEDFTTLDKFDATSTAVWNKAQARVHVPLVIDRSMGAGRTEDDSVNIGNGSDGSFNSSTYSAFDVGGLLASSVITLDSTRTYQFTDFTLDTGYTLRALGTTPLSIRVQGSVTIRGTIQLSGSSGGTAGTSSNGGASCCGGKAGGNGGVAGATGLTGDPAGTLGGGIGGGGATGAQTSGGGGGGGHDTAGLSGQAGTGGAAGGAGQSYSNVFISPLAGGSGGGGGGGHDTSGTGGGGGGGGGVLSLHAGGNFIVESQGKILTNGGAGGGGNASSLAGSGGGGSAGAILIFTGGTLTNQGLIQSIGGAAGSGTSGGNGGQGSRGRIRLVSGTGNYGPSDSDPPPSTSPYGQIYYRVASFQVISGIYDSRNTAPSYVRIDKDQSTPGGASITYTIAGSTDGFVSDDTGFVTESQLSLLQGKRYFRWKATLTSVDRTQSTEIRALRFILEDHIQNEFSLGLSGCAAANPQNARGEMIFWLLAVSLILFAIRVRLKAKPQSELDNPPQNI